MKHKSRCSAVLERLKGSIIGQVKPDINKGVSHYTSGWHLTYNGGHGAGFTLIELLVVVLIIGILASIAIPQYQKAVWKSRNTQLKTLIKTVVQAEEVYKLGNGAYALDFSELAVDLPLSSGSPECNFGVHGEDSGRHNEQFVFVLNNSHGNSAVVGVLGAYRQGKYKCAGFTYSLLGQRTFCIEGALYTAGKGNFCEKIERGTLAFEDNGTAFYSLP